MEGEGGGGGVGMEVEVVLSMGALEAMWREDGLRPVLQLADDPRMEGRYRVELSDGGARLQPGMISASLNHLVSRGALRRGTVIRVIEYFAGFIRNQRVIIVIQLEILHAECTLICSPAISEANATQHIGVSCSGGLAIHEPVTATGLSGAMAAQLTPGAVVAISEHADSNGTLQPMLQVVDVRIVNNPRAERFRMVLSDGVYMMHSMLVTAENTLVRDGSFQKGSIIQLQEFSCRAIQNRRIIIVIRLDVLQSECDIIGNPKPYVMRNQPNEQVTNLPANGAQANTDITRISLSREISNMSRNFVRNFVRKTIAQIKDENLGRSDKPDFVTVRAVLSHMRTDKFSYPACTLELNGKRCYKKVRRNGDGTWYCNRCNQRTENCEYRYVLSCQIKDHTCTIYAVALQEAGEAIL